MTLRLSALRGVSLMIAVCKKSKNQIVWPPANSVHLFKTLPPIREVDYVSAIYLIDLRNTDCISENIHGHRIIDEVCN